MPMGELGYYPLGFGLTFLFLSLFAMTGKGSVPSRTCNSCGFRWTVWNPVPKQKG